MSGGISRDEWLKALEDAGVHSTVDDQDALTMAEVAQMLSITPLAAKLRMDTMVKLGRAKATFKWGTASNGRRQHLKAYRLIEEPKRGKRR